MRSLLLAGVLAAALALPRAGSAQGLSGFNVFTVGNFAASYTDVNGSLAVGGNATVSSFRIGDELARPFTGNSLVVGGTFSWMSGEIARGNAVVGANVHPSWQTRPNNNGGGSFTTSPDAVAAAVDFEAQAAFLRGLSTSIGSASATGLTTRWSTGQLDFVADPGSDYNVFTVDARDLASSHTILFRTKPGATNVINVVGNVGGSVFGWAGTRVDCTTLRHDGSIDQNGCAAQGHNTWQPATARRIVYNFAGADQLALRVGASVVGSILAPASSVTLGYGSLFGELVAGSATSNMEFHGAFEGTIVRPPVVVPPVEVPPVTDLPPAGPPGTQPPVGDLPPLDTPIGDTPIVEAPTVVPEPATLVLTLAGLAGIGLVARMRRHG